MLCISFFKLIRFWKMVYWPSHSSIKTSQTTEAHKLLLHIGHLLWKVLLIGYKWCQNLTEEKTVTYFCFFFFLRRAATYPPLLRLLSFDYFCETTEFISFRGLLTVVCKKTLCWLLTGLQKFCEKVSLYYLNKESFWREVIWVCTVFDSSICKDVLWWCGDQLQD